MQKALVNGRVVLVQDKESGLVELGVLFIDSSSKGRKQPNSTKMRVLSLHMYGSWDAELAEKTLDHAKKELKGVDLHGKQLVKGKWDLGEDEGDEMERIRLPICDQRTPFHFKIAEIDSEQLIHVLMDRLHVSWKQIFSEKTASPDPVSKVLEELDQIRKTGLNFMEMKLSSNVDLLKPLNERQELIEQLTSHPVHDCPGLPQKYSRIHNEQELQKDLKELRHRISDAALKQVFHFSCFLFFLFLYSIFNYPVFLFDVFLIFPVL